MSILGSGSVHVAQRYAKKPAKAATAANIVCQKCLQAGHWTYECKNTAVYQMRPSRTKQLKDPKRRQAFMDPTQLLPEMQDGDKKAKKRRKKESSSDSSSSSSDDSSSSSGSDDSSSSSSSSSDSDSSSSESSSASSDSSDDSSSGTESSSSDSDSSSSEDAKIQRINQKTLNRLKGLAEQPTARSMSHQQNIQQGRGEDPRHSHHERPHDQEGRHRADPAFRERPTERLKAEARHAGSQQGRHEHTESGRKRDRSPNPRRERREKSPSAENDRWEMA